jgi:hypothetical protein
MIGSAIVICVILGVIYDYFCHKLLNMKTEAWKLCQKQLDIMYDQKEFGYYNDIKYVFNLNMVNSKKRNNLIEEIEKTELFQTSSSNNDNVVFHPTKKANETLLNRSNQENRQ